MSRYIDADVLIDDLIHNRSFYPALVAGAIKNTPTADVVEVEVVSKIFEEIEHTVRAAIILLKFEKDEEIRNIKTECYTDLIGYISELKKKYTEGENTK